jgi:2-polyprenyl-3-methyl-5-hydroxy-6-metoxy-1,4-benzoquinol methylase
MVKRKFISFNRRLSLAFDQRFIPKKFSVDGLKDFHERLAPSHVGSGQNIYDIGGGKIPFFTAEAKKRKKLRVTGIDIDEQELKRAPTGSYDETVVSDIATFRPKKAKADVVICQAVLEHVANTPAAVSAIGDILKPGGKALLFIPNRNALFARINLILPEAFKRKILFKIFPETEHAQGFPAYYNKCTPRAFKRLCSDNDLVITELQGYYFVTYFSFFFPAHLLWRFGQMILYPVFRENISEAFAVIAVKQR